MKQIGTNEISRKRSLRRLWLSVGASLGALFLVVAVLIFGFRDAILNGYAKGKAERAFAKAYPGAVLRFGELDYSMSANRLVAQSVTLIAANSTLKTGRISLTSACWARVLGGTVAWPEVLAQASLEATNIVMEFPQALYGLRCARLRASVPDSELIAEGTELRTLVGDEDYFAASAFRKTKFHAVAPECRVLGLEYGALFRGTSYRASSVHFSQPSFDALVNRDKPVQPLANSPLMVHEALATIRQPMRLDRLSITNGHLTYRERVKAGADPGALTFGAVGIFVAGIANRGETSSVIQVQAQGDFMNAGVLKVLMTIPVNSPDFSMHYSGSLGAMDLPSLNAFLDITEHIRIKSGRVQEATFAINVTAGQARGSVRAIYQDLVVAVLDSQTGKDAGLGNRIASFLANAFKVRNASTQDVSGALKEGVVNYTRKPDEEFLEFAWSALRTGVLNVISLGGK